MEKKDFYKKTTILFVLLLLWNPITLWLLSKKLILSFLISLGVIILYFVSDSYSKFRLKVWLFNILMIGSVFFHSELIFRTIFSNRDIPNLYSIRKGYYFNKPLLEQYFNNIEYFSQYRTNIQGYRIDAETNNLDSINKCDWLFIGDSFTQGAQVDYSQIFTSLVYKDFCDKIIINAGISGAGICDELNYYKDEGSKLKPQKVFLQIGVFNDFYNVFERTASWKDYLIDLSSLYRYAEYNLTSNPNLKLGRWTEPFASSPEENADYNILYKTFSETKIKDLEMFEKYLSEFNSLVQSNGAELIVLLIPSKEQISEQCLKEVLTAYEIKEEDLDLNYPSIYMEGLSSKYNFKLIDLYDDFRLSGNFPFYNIDEHMNYTGHMLIANRLRRELSDNISSYSYLSKSNANDRYPTIYDDGFSILYQNYINGKYNIVLSNSSLENPETIITAGNEVIHPMLSHDKNFIVYTEGDQEHGLTDIVLYDLANHQKTIITSSENQYGAIPQFNKACDKIAFASWTIDSNHVSTNPTISIYDLKTKEIETLDLGQSECWRPVFYNNDNSILYLSRNASTNNFVVYSYSLNDKKISCIIEQTYDIWDIAVSPSERYIAYSGNKLGNWDLYLYDTETLKNTQLTFSLGNEWDPAFGYYENELWFAGTSGINNGIYYITLDDTIIDNN